MNPGKNKYLEEGDDDEEFDDEDELADEEDEE